MNNTNQTALSDYKKKKQKYSLTAMTSASLVIAAIIIFNLIFSVLGVKINLKLDLTKDSILSFSDTTKNVIDKLSMDVRIMSLIPESDTNREMVQIDEVLKKYDLASSKITYERVDATKNPKVLSDYPLDGKALSSNYYVIFASDKMHQVVSVDDLLIMYANDAHRDTVLSGALKAEQYFSSALVRVTEGSEINALVAKGHGEKYTADNFRLNIFPGAGYNFSEINLSSQDISPDSDVLIIVSPKTDYSQEEINKIDAFSRNGGSIQIIADTVTEELPNLFGYMREWGISFGEGMAAEGDSSSYSGEDVSIIARLGKNTITDTMGIDDQIVNFTFARPINITKKTNIEVNTLATTSPKGYILSGEEKTNENSALNLAVAASKSVSYDKVSHMSVIGTRHFVSDLNAKDFRILDITANRRFLSGIMSYITDQPTNFYIMPKNIVQDEVVISQMSIYVYTMITVVFIPLVLISLGIIIWLRRRHS